MRSAGAAAVAALLIGTTVTSCSDDDAPDGDSASTTTTVVLDARPGRPGVGDPYFPNAGNGGYDVRDYHIDLEWRPATSTIHATTTVSLVATQDLSRLNLDLVGLKVALVTVDGARARVARRGRELLVTPSAPIAEGDEVDVAVTYSGTPERVPLGTRFFETGWVVDGREAFVVSEPVGAASWFPSNDHPTDKARYTFVITAPSDLEVAANGRRAGVVHHRRLGTRTWTYEATQPMATYLAQVAIADLELERGTSAGEVAIRNAFHTSVAKTAAHDFGRTTEMIEFFVDRFGPYPFDVYGVVVVDEPLGFALETQTLSLFGTDFVSGSRDAEPVVAHELVHQWFGNSVSPRTWRDIWLNEGFATYGEWLWVEHAYGVSVAEIARDAVSDSSSLTPPPGDPGNEELFTSSVYRRAGALLQALREQVGDRTFFRLLRVWASRYRHAAAGTDDFVALAEEVTGRQLDRFFDAWLRAERPPAFGPLPS